MLDELTINKLKKLLTKGEELDERYFHSERVLAKALEINRSLNLGLDEEKVEKAAFLHDSAKLVSKADLSKILFEDLKLDESLKKHPSIWHAFAGPYVVGKEFGIDDEEILSAIRYHTTGRPEMSVLEQLIFVSDYIEDGRVGPYLIRPRLAASLDLDYACFVILEQMVEYLKSSNLAIYQITLDTYHYYENKHQQLLLDRTLKYLDKAVVNDIKTYDVRSKTPFFDYVVIASSQNARQAASAIGYVKEMANKYGYQIVSVDEHNLSEWFLIDLAQVVVHVFVGNTRSLYDLDTILEK